MAQHMSPIIGNWYKTLDDEVFEVVAVDDDDGTIEIQYASGDVEELDLEDWNEMVAGPGEPAEDWSAGFDAEEYVEDYNDIDISVRAEDW